MVEISKKIVAFSEYMNFTKYVLGGLSNLTKIILKPFLSVIGTSLSLNALPYQAILRFYNVLIKGWLLKVRYFFKFNFLQKTNENKSTWEFIVVK